MGDTTPYAAFPDSLERFTPRIGYMPGPMPWFIGGKLHDLGVEIVNRRDSGAIHRDRDLITGDSPKACVSQRTRRHRKRADRGGRYTSSIYSEIVVAIDNGAVLEILRHPNSQRYANQRIYVVESPVDASVSVDNVTEARERSIEYASATLKKNRRMNIRVSERDVLQLKARAAEEGIPYKTLGSMILHKYVTGRLVERTRR